MQIPDESSAQSMIGALIEAERIDGSTRTQSF